MKALFGIGLALLVLGVVSLLVPIPRHEREGVSLGGVSIGVETRHNEKASPVVSAALLLGGVGLLVAGKRKG
jgi:hypothetical protein